MQPLDRTFSICERATELMRAFCDSASPRSYEIWFTYVAGIKPELNTEVKGLLKSGTKLSGEDIETVYRRHLSDERLSTSADETSSAMLAEVGKVMTFLDTALRSTAKYDQSLTALTADLETTGQPEDLRAILKSLMASTNEVASTNRMLETRLLDSRGEIDTLRQTLESVKKESLTDALTGIANRKMFETALADATAHAARTSEPLALIVIDIDHFKRFNDTYGHLTGDQVLRLVSAAMREHVDPDTTLARFGGEEFGMVLPRLGREDAVACGEVVRRSVESRELLKRTTGESLGRVTISLGVAVLRPGETATSLLERADTCMYHAKRTGRNRTVSDEGTAISDAA